MNEGNRTLPSWLVPFLLAGCGTATPPGGPEAQTDQPMVEAKSPRRSTAPAPPHYLPPSYAALDQLEASQVLVGTGKWTLPATLTLPRLGRPCPAVVLVHGSGPVDRDGTLGPNKPFADLALGLASRGIGVLRYEKRTRHHGKAVAQELGDNLTLEEETIADAVAAAQLLRATQGVDPRRTFVLGHSLGGMAIPRIAKAAAGPRGFIILAGSTVPLEDTILRQIQHLSRLDGRLSAAERQIIDKIKAQAARVKTLRPGSQVAGRDLPLGLAPPYWLDLARHRPALELATETRPILVLHGDRDYQVTLEDFAGWQRALADKPNGMLKRYRQLNHLFMRGAGPSSPADYRRPGHVAAEVIQDIANWIAKH
jgi:fermentation-respiration switch protein FrsA (DUF1100 family)